MRIYRHRINTIEELNAVAASVGVEFDLRSERDGVVVAHDPFVDGPRLEEYLGNVGPRPCIFNIKCEGIEEYVIGRAREAKIDAFFLLDVSVPAAVKLARRGERRFAARFSEMEPEEGVLRWRGLAEWLWVDCFDHYPYGDYERLGATFRTCFVSPELQGHSGAAAEALVARARALGPAAVCTKEPGKWTFG